MWLLLVLPTEISPPALRQRCCCLSVATQFTVIFSFSENSAFIFSWDLLRCLGLTNRTGVHSGITGWSSRTPEALLDFCLAVRKQSTHKTSEKKQTNKQSINYKKAHLIAYLFVFLWFLYFHLYLLPWNHAVFALFPVLQILKEKHI